MCIRCGILSACMCDVYGIKLEMPQCWVRPQIGLPGDVPLGAFSSQRYSVIPGSLGLTEGK